jgi:hypothetical protein
MAGRAKENLPGGSLKYLFVYLNVVTVVIIPSPVHLTSQKAWFCVGTRWNSPEPPTVHPQFLCKGKKEQFNMNGWLVVMVNSG